jgi:hypothetical protein
VGTDREGNGVGMGGGGRVWAAACVFFTAHSVSGMVENKVANVAELKKIRCFYSI